jgi:plasmid maintenance system killer protein
MEDGVTVRVSDLRVTQAQRHGIVVGLPRKEAQQIAMIADLLSATTEWRDLTFMFDRLAHHEGRAWKVPVDQRWWLLFEWIEGFGPVNIRLLE